MSFPFRGVRTILLGLFGGFFLLFGIQVLVAAYRLKDPFSFVLTFFASNLIILVSAVALVGVFFSIRRCEESRQPEPRGAEDPNEEGGGPIKG